MLVKRRLVVAEVGKPPLLSAEVRELLQRFLCNCLIAGFLLLKAGMGPLVSAQIGELRVGLPADIAPEWLEAAVDVSVLLETTWSGERLPALQADVVPASQVLGSNVALEIAGVCEDSVARGALVGWLSGVFRFLFLFGIRMDSVPAIKSNMLGKLLGMLHN